MTRGLNGIIHRTSTTSTILSFQVEYHNKKLDILHENIYSQPCEKFSETSNSRTLEILWLKKFPKRTDKNELLNDKTLICENIGILIRLVASI